MSGQDLHKFRCDLRQNTSAHKLPAKTISGSARPLGAELASCVSSVGRGVSRGSLSSRVVGPVGLGVSPPRRGRSRSVCGARGPGGRGMGSASRRSCSPRGRGGRRSPSRPRRVVARVPSVARPRRLVARSASRSPRGRGSPSAGAVVLRPRRGLSSRRGRGVGLSPPPRRVPSGSPAARSPSGASGGGFVGCTPWGCGGRVAPAVSVAGGSWGWLCGVWRSGRVALPSCGGRCLGRCGSRVFLALFFPAFVLGGGLPFLAWCAVRPGFSCWVGPCVASGLVPSPCSPLPRGRLIVTSHSFVFDPLRFFAVRSNFLHFPNESRLF